MRSKVLLLVGLSVVFATAIALSAPGAARAHNDCSLQPLVPNLFGAYPTQQAQGWGQVTCSSQYDGDVRLRGSTGSGWTVLDTYSYSWYQTMTYKTGKVYCQTYHFVDSFMYANFGGHGHTNNSSSTDCNLP